MAWSVRSIVSITVPALSILVGLFWFRSRKSPKPPDKSIKNAAQNEKTQPNTTKSVAAKEKVVAPASELYSSGDGPHMTPGIKPAYQPVVEEKIQFEKEATSQKVPVRDDIKSRERKESKSEVEKITEVTTVDSAVSIEDKIKIEDRIEISKASTVESAAPIEAVALQVDTTISCTDCLPDDHNSSTSNTSQLSWADSIEQEEELHNNNTHEYQGKEKKEKSTDCPRSRKSSNTKRDKQIESERKKGTPSASMSNGPVSVSTEDEVSATIGNMQVPTPAKSSDSPNSLSGPGSSDSGSLDHDVHSELSADSGRGGSVMEMASPEILNELTPIIYEFDFPTVNCGMLIGKNGRTINRVKELAGVEITVNNKLYTPDYQLVVMEGNSSQIEKALSLLRDRFPIERFPDINFDPAPQEAPVLVPELMQLSIPEGVYVDVLVSSVVSPNHIFLQQPTHPSFHMLETLNQCMNTCYAQESVPDLPRPIEVGVICAAPMFNTGWYRSQVVQSYPDSDEVDLRFVDYGGYMTMQGSLLKQIRSDFSQLPFQAVECYMANLMPPKGMDNFPAESNALVEQMVQGKLLQAQIVGQEADGVPYVQLYEVQGDQTNFINRDLVNNGVGQWLEHLL